MIKTITIANAKEDAAKLRNSSISISDLLIQGVASIMNDVAEHGDAAIIDYTKKFDGVRLNSLKVTEEEFEQAYSMVTTKQIQAINVIKRRLMKSEDSVMNHLEGITISSAGIKVHRLIQPIPSVGCYIPGGNARYASTMVMCAVPAKVAGVNRIVAISPPQRDGTVDPLTLVAARICGVKEFYKIGGVQGIAALAYGTPSIERVSKIVGPGGMFVTAAKFLASRKVSIDMVAGPTELIVYADSKSDPKLIALDLVSQAEHSYDTFCGLVTTSKQLARHVSAEIKSVVQSNSISRADIVRKSLQKNGFIAICKRQSIALEFINEIAPEHLQLVCKNARAMSKKITSAGLVLIGKYTPSSASDYCFGSNHILPTLGFGKSRGSLSVLDFLKLVSTIEATKSGLEKVQTNIREITSAEGLINHYSAVQERTMGK
ncbi:MAG TPA: histidinol dehydrogenase [Candidatus Nitrosopolaris sp.]|nr:histidinol dehydrogenase [Candidatus Nitrosopolaris sp.]